MLHFEQARTGDSIPLWNSRALASRFDPHREAERFARQSIQSGPDLPDRLLIVGDVSGYLGQAVRKLCPAAEIAGIVLHPELAPPPGIYDVCWLPGSEPVEAFLDRLIREESVRGLVLLQWPPSIKAFTRLGTDILNSIQRRIRIINGNLTTLKAFGRRWIRNSLLNYLYVDQFAVPAPLKGAVIIAASGATLADSADLLQKTQASIMALPSSLRFLNSIQRSPSLIIQTDPGFYASYHLREAAGQRVPMAAPLSAVPDIRKNNGPIIPLSYGEALEERLFALLGIQPLRVPAMGTVAATAMVLAVSMGADPVILAGLDLSYDDIHTHVRPHSFDAVFSETARRTSPLYSRKYRYSRDGAAGGQSAALKTYRDWFAGMGKDLQSRVMRLNPSQVELPFPSVSEHEVRALHEAATPPAIRSTAAPDFARRRKDLISLLTSLPDEIADAPDSPLARELRQKLTFVEEFGRHNAKDSSRDHPLMTVLEELKSWVSRLEAP